MTEKKINALLTDQYVGLLFNKFEKFLENENIKHIQGWIHTPSSNGMTKRINQMLVNTIRCILNENESKRNWREDAEGKGCTKIYRNETFYNWFCTTLFCLVYETT